MDDKLIFDDVSEYLALLPQERQEKIARYRFEKDKLLSLAAGLLIRRTIGESPITLGEHGKPYAESGGFFSVSHSGGIAAIAVDDTEIGLDVEKLPEESRLKIADRFYHPAERDHVKRADNPRRAFCEIWTRKEAYLKMTGEGISTDLTAFDTTCSPLKERLYTTSLDKYCLSICSAEPIGDKAIYISELELKSLM
ncbi:MAG: 4'-phosphopantetheinyl transferase superfamily protein [Ruminococcus sp.]|uniref:4'-phosphopantetheinyl transferase family protein n=1 Tax=Ruminococcus sp. TaxID=41978 RepID=UPI0028734611|nr:4'-phosphopantetheinyl transferase superfamily protein [Ruminococcus sp.]MBQ3285659.1 4'-phosphopantetheinyl transferase superfamily protein [Ruminococcus sp.]